MRVWIIGKRGMLARAMQRRCAIQGIDYVATSRKEVDIEDEKALAAQFETLHFTHVVNCSGYTAVDRAEEEEERAQALNVLGPKRLAILAKRYKKKLIHFSTDYVFDGSKERYGEGEKTAPLSAYGRSKEAGEKALFEHFEEACLVRTSWLFGKEGDNFVKKMVQLMQERKELSVVDDQRGRPTYVDDLAEAVLTLLDRSGIFHFANSGAISWYEWAHAIREKLKKRNVPLRCHKIVPITTEAHGAKALRPRSSILLTEQFETPHWDAGLEEVLSACFPT